MRFSQRIGKTPIKSLLQVEEIDEDLMNRLWSTILDSFFYKLGTTAKYGESEINRFCLILWKEFFKLPIDTIPSFNNGQVYHPEVISYLRKWFYDGTWYDIYDLVEFIAQSDEDIMIGFASNCNTALEIEVSGYRIVDNRIVQITSDLEVQEIEDALSGSEKINSVNTHLKYALDMLADRKAPDYRNSIKESISAVEAMCIIITGEKTATLGKALSMIEKSHALHGALKNAFSSLYGYTSDKGGIRHALLEDDVSVSFEDAKFMLVSCSAFINYLQTKVNGHVR